jgi:hypothetical protein
MAHFFALDALVFMMGFVATFDSYHRRRKSARILQSVDFLSPEEVARFRAIWDACQEDAEASLFPQELCRIDAQ